jgi:hypothetical protein
MNDMQALLERSRAAQASRRAHESAPPPKWHKSQGGPGFYLAIVMEEEPRIGAYELELTPELIQAAPDSFLRWMEERTYGAPYKAALVERGRRVVERLLNQQGAA